MHFYLLCYRGVHIWSLCISHWNLGQSFSCARMHATGIPQVCTGLTAIVMDVSALYYLNYDLNNSAQFSSQLFKTKQFMPLFRYYFAQKPHLMFLSEKRL